MGWFAVCYWVVALIAEEVDWLLSVGRGEREVAEEAEAEGEEGEETAAEETEEEEDKEDDGDSAEWEDEAGIVVTVLPTAAVDGIGEVEDELAWFWSPGLASVICITWVEPLDSLLVNETDVAWRGVKAEEAEVGEEREGVRPEVGEATEEAEDEEELEIVRLLRIWGCTKEAVGKGGKGEEAEKVGTTVADRAELLELVGIEGPDEIVKGVRGKDVNVGELTLDCTAEAGTEDGGE